jgi:LytS/YehU family sensor histidine kinase
VRNMSWLSKLVAAVVIALAMAAPVSACPMCKVAAEQSTRQPRAYMFSILFMMGMPMMLTTGFGIAFYRLSRQADRMRQEEADRLAAEAGELPSDEVL